MPRRSKQKIRGPATNTQTLSPLTDQVINSSRDLRLANGIDSEIQTYRSRRANLRSGLPMPNVPNTTKDGRIPNPADPRTWISNELQLGSTILGRHDALRILHPCGEGCMDYCKIPDGAVSTSVPYPRRDEFEIQSGQDGTSATADTWNCVVFHLPLLLQRDIVLRWKGGISVSTTDLYTVVQTVLNKTAWTKNTPGDSFVVKSLYPDWGQVVDTIAVEYTILVPNTFAKEFISPRGSFSDMGESFRAIRRACCGYTTDFDAATIQNQGRVVSGQWSPNITLGVTNKYTSVVKDSTTTPPTMQQVLANVADCYTIELPAIITTDIVGSDEYVRQALAKTGSYMPMRTSEATVSFTASFEGRTIVATAPGGGRSDQFSNSYVPAQNYDVWLRGWNTGVEAWTGMHVTAELRIKVREDLELIPAPASEQSPHLTEGHPYDVRAIQLIREFSRREPHAWPASYNERNKLWGKILSGLASVLKSTGLPVISQVAEPVANALNQLIYR